MNDYYVYMLYRIDTGIPFYVGKGRGDRWVLHERGKVRGNPYKDNIIKKMKTLFGVQSIPKIKVYEGLTNDVACIFDVACILERQLICDIGRFPKDE